MTEHWWWPCRCGHEHLRHDEKGCANTRVEYNPFIKAAATVSCICSTYRPAENSGYWTYDDAQRAHELAQQLHDDHGGYFSSCVCCCEDEGCEALGELVAEES